MNPDRFCRAAPLQAMETRHIRYSGAKSRILWPESASASGHLSSHVQYSADFRQKGRRK
ncbi:hypothetical protein L21SP2_0522 [Salinispira pacifica]|uniref:Uncharacterized protein n=1 Tax=Salinispira pacifica TaxID=1307761 RepID=V5WEG2_9SPIO|nr:hypothetical protein L21SP2_0522 [Salinispira pacifica]